MTSHPETIAFLDFPYDLLGWLGLILLTGFLGWAVWKQWEGLRGYSRREWIFLAGLIIATPLTARLLSIALPFGESIPIPGVLRETGVSLVYVLAALPWALAAGLLGVLPALGLAAITGLLMALNDSHSIFSIVEIIGLAFLFAAAVRQRYRTRFYVLLRHPAAAAFIIALIFIPLRMVSALFATSGAFAVRLDYALTQSWVFSLARGIELVLAGIVCETIVQLKPKWWVNRSPWIPSPVETSLQLKFYSGTAPLVIVLFLTLIVGDWIVSGNAARTQIQQRMESAATVAAESLPYFMETGQNLVHTYATPDLLILPKVDLDNLLSERLRSVPFFRELMVFDRNGSAISGYPVADAESLRMTPEEKAGVQLALKGVLNQTYVAPPWPGEETVQISFLGVITDNEGAIAGVLLGRTDLGSNPFTQPVLQAFASLGDLNGSGAILDENEKFLYHTISTLVEETYYGELPQEAEFFEDTSSLGDRELVYYKPVLSRQWGILMAVPAEQAQSLALQIAAPLLVMLLILSIAAFLALRFALRPITTTLGTLSQEAARISQGELDHALMPVGEDEVGRLSRSFEQMRIGLQTRLRELNRLLGVSQGVAANLEAGEAIRYILEAALGEGASSARVVLVSEVALDPTLRQPVAYGVGRARKQYSYLDQQIYDLIRQQEMITLPNLGRMRRLVMPENGPRPGALAALALHHEDDYYGVLWVAYDHPHKFSDEEVRFLSTLAGQAALAAANARLYATAEVGRQRLEAVLASTPEPVLVIDDQMRLLLVNPAALQVPGLVNAYRPGALVNEVVSKSELLDLVTQPLESKLASREMALSNGRIFFATVSPVMVDSRLVGRVCILQDISHYKELDTMKSDFVATVSHNFRSPLMLMHGYATMLKMVGDLNEQQKSYIEKIFDSVDTMSRLVNNLLDLGRIEAGIGLRIEKVSAGDLIDKVVSQLKPQALQKNITLINEVNDGSGLLLEADRALVEQALLNLVENAIKFTGMKGTVQVDIQVKPTTLVFLVKDTGRGIAPLDLPNLFQKFYKSGQKESHQQKGTGLGLAIVKSIADRHGGQVRVESQLGKGTTFYLELPLQHPDEVNQAVKA